MNGLASNRSLYSLCDILYRIIADKSEDFQGHHDLVVTQSDGYDNTGNIELLNLRAVNPKDLPSLPSVMALSSAASTETFMSILQDLTGLYASSNHYFEQVKRGRARINKTVIQHFDCEALSQLDCSTAKRISEQILAPNRQMTVMVSGLDAITKTVTAEQLRQQGDMAFSKMVVRAFLAQAIKDQKRDGLIVLTGETEDIDAFLRSSPLNDFYNNLFADDQENSVYKRYRYLKYCLKDQEFRKKIDRSFCGLDGVDQAIFFKEFEGRIRPLLIDDDALRLMVDGPYSVPKNIGLNLILSIYSLFDNEHFRLTQSASHMFRNVITMMNISYYDGLALNGDAHSGQGAIDVLAAEVISQAIDRLGRDAKLSDDPSKDRFDINIFNILNSATSGRHATFEKIVIKSEDVYRAVLFLTGYSFFGHSFRNDMIKRLEAIRTRLDDDSEKPNKIIPNPYGSTSRPS